MVTRLQTQLSTYAAYHRDARNRATHFVGVPAITFALLTAASFVRLATVGSWPLTLSTLLAVVVMFYWMVLDFRLGLLASLLHVPLLGLAAWTAELPSSTGWTVVGVTFVGGWTLQLVGHVLEGRRPALVDNIMQILIAPLFLVTETVVGLGWRRGLRDVLRAR